MALKIGLKARLNFPSLVCAAQGCPARDLLPFQPYTEIFDWLVWQGSLLVREKEGKGVKKTT